MAKINVPRAELCELCGLPADADDETLSRRMAELLAAREAGQAQAVAAAAEQQEIAQDKRIVAAAINDGRLPAERATFWLDALKRDRGNRVIIASLAPGLKPAETVAADAESERTHTKLMARLGLAPEPRTVAASADPFADQRERQVLDAFGLPVAQTPAPVVIQKGTDPADWTREQRADAMQRKLGPRFHPGTKPAPPADVVYIPSPNDPYRWDGSTGQFVEKHPYREVPRNG